MLVSSESTKEDVFESIGKFLQSENLPVSNFDKNRPWGGLYVIDENKSETFIRKFFPHLSKADLEISGKLSPKILVVAPGKRLSWQYHHRRAEIWKLIGGEAAVATSDTNQEKDLVNLAIGDIVELKQGERHRLIGMDNWGVVAEIWQHTDSDNPSNEDDIVRLQDDFGR
jgi:mannose-6-phosphate isomerase-like protein (cupin superfamily)